MPIVEVKLWEGRTREQKAELTRRFTDAMVEVTGCPATAVFILFEDYAKSNWASGGALVGE